MDHSKHFWRAVLLAALTGAVSACTFGRAYSRYAGVSYIAPIGNPRASDLAWSPKNPSQLLVTSKHFMFGPVNVSLLNLETGRTSTLAHTDLGDIGNSAWSPDGRYVTLSVSGGSKGYDGPGLFLLNTEDDSMQRINDSPGITVWLQGGNALGWLGPDPAPGQGRLAILLIDIRTGAEKLLYSSASDDAFAGASVSPDGNTLAFALYTIATGASDIYVLDLRTGSVAQLTHNGNSAFPAWSPKGNLIAYDRTERHSWSTNFLLHLITPNGSCDVKIPELNDGTSPVWSPDASQLAFIGPDGIYLLDIATFMKKYGEPDSCLKF